MSQWHSRFDPRRSIRAKLVLGSVVLLGTTSAFFSSYYPTRLERATVEEFQGRTTSVGRMVGLAVGVGLASNDLSAVAEAFEWAKGDSTLAYLAVRDPDGSVFASFAVDGIDIDRALAVHHTEESALQTATIPIRYRDENFGSLDIGFSRRALDGKVASDRRLFMLAGLSVVLLGAMLSHTMAGRISGPLERLSQEMQKVAQGDLEVSLAVYSLDEVGILSASSVRMLDSLKHTLEKLETRAEELEQARINADAASLAKSQFLATMSHEIRTPMNGVLGMAQLLETTELDDAQRRQVEVILSSGSALLTVINDILEFSVPRQNLWVIWRRSG